MLDSCQGQVYVLISRVTDPDNLELIGVPPKDLIDEIALALFAAGKDPDSVFTKCVEVGKTEWRYDLDARQYLQPHSNCFRQVYNKNRTVPMVHRSLDECLNPQPIASKVLLKLLQWIDRVDICSQKTGVSRPEFVADDGSQIFPPEGDPDERWWLTELSGRKEGQRIDQEQLLEEGGHEQGFSSDSGESDSVNKKGENDETDVSDDDSFDAGHDDSLSTLGNQRSTRVLPLSKGAHSSRTSYHQATAL